MYRFSVANDRSLYLLTSGNLATSQAVVAHIQSNVEEGAEFNISKAKNKKVDGPDADSFAASVTLILGGQIAGGPSELYLIYPEGNHITASEQQTSSELCPLASSNNARDEVERPRAVILPPSA
jgi:putative proteasome-type protease